MKKAITSTFKYGLLLIVISITAFYFFSDKFGLDYVIPCYGGALLGWFIVKLRGIGLLIRLFQNGYHISIFMVVFLCTKN